MPVYLRKFYFNKLVDVKKEEKKEHDKAMKKNKNIKRPNIRKR